MRFRFAHLADLHLDTPFQGLRANRPGLAATLRDASLTAWDHAVTACLAAEVDFVVIAGDVYDGAEAGVRAQLRFRDGLARLAAAGVQSFVVHGNHDPLGGRWSAISDWPPGVTVFGHDEVTSVPVVKHGQPLALVHGISHARPEVTENLALRFQRDSSFVGYQVGLLHANIDGRGGHANYAPATLADLRASGMDYWALGHVHVRAVLSHERPLAIYPGNLQARHVNETGEKGFYLVDVEDGRASASFVEVGLVRFDTIHLDIAGLASVAEVHSALTTEARLPRGTALTHVLRATLHGSGPAHSALHKAGEAGLLEYLVDVAPAGVWWDEVRLRTRPELDRETRLRAGDFIADLLTLSDARRPNAAEHVATLVAELQSHPQLRNVADHLGLEALIDEAQALWDEAAIAAFDLIDAELAEG